MIVFVIELTGECLKCFIRLTRDVPAVVVQSEALWARIPEIQVRIMNIRSHRKHQLTPSSMQAVQSSSLGTIPIAEKN